MWRTIAKMHNKNPEEMAVVMENVSFRRATILTRESPVRFLINILEGTGEFNVCEGGAPVVTGTVRVAPDPAAERGTLPPGAAPPTGEPVTISNLI